MRTFCLQWSDDGNDAVDARSNPAGSLCGHRSRAQSGTPSDRGSAHSEPTVMDGPALLNHHP